MSAFAGAANNGILLYFDEREHKYKDNAGNPYTSCTQILEKYKPKFDSVKVAGYSVKKPSSKYYGWTVPDVLKDWERINKERCDIGVKKHDYMEQAIKASSGYRKHAGTVYINDRIYTVADIIKNKKFGQLDLNYFVQTGIKDRYPLIYNTIATFVKKGFKIYSEIGTYSFDYLTSGLIDVLFVRDNEFCILDWKTNIDSITDRCGYFVKDKQGVRTTEWIDRAEYFLPPISHLLNSSWNVYSLQLAIYTYLTEMLGLTPKLNVLYHIKDEIVDGLEKIESYTIPYLRNEARAIIEDHYSTFIKKHNSQLQLNFK